MRKQLDKYEGNWEQFYSDLMKLTTETMVISYHSSFKEMFERGSSPERALRVILRTNFNT